MRHGRFALCFLAMIVETITDRDTWNNNLRILPHAHILQTWEWGDFKQATTGWTPTRLIFRQDETVLAMASLLERRIGPLRVIYVPKGPVFQSNAPTADVLSHLERQARAAVWLKIDPDIVAATGEDDNQPDPDGTAFIELLKQRGWRSSADQVQFRNTITIDLTRSEDQILAAMSQNTRRKVRTAAKKNVTIREGSTADLDTLYRLYRVTGERDDFLIRPPDYYRRAWQDFIEAGLAHVLIAELDGQAIAHVILMHFGQKCWYFYGASSNEERNRMPNYALQWEAMRWAKKQGYSVYDMWGAPSVFDESDPMWGVYGFKRGFRGTVTRYVGAWDYAPLPPLYTAYTRLWPRILQWMRGG